MKFSINTCVGFLIGYFVLARTVADLATRNFFGVVSSIVGILLALALGLLVGGLKS